MGTEARNGVPPGAENFSVPSEDGVARHEAAPSEHDAETEQPVLPPEVPKDRGIVMLTVTREGRSEAQNRQSEYDLAICKAGLELADYSRWHHLVLARFLKNETDENRQAIVDAAREVVDKWGWLDTSRSYASDEEPEIKQYEATAYMQLGHARETLKHYGH